VYYFKYTTGHFNVCDYGHDTLEEIRRLPFGTDNEGVLVCYEHYLDMVKTNNDLLHWRWESLKVYSEAVVEMGLP
jgi:hypothetical protein